MLTKICVYSKTKHNHIYTFHIYNDINRKDNCVLNEIIERGFLVCIVRLYQRLLTSDVAVNFSISSFGKMLYSNCNEELLYSIGIPVDDTRPKVNKFIYRTELCHFINI